jgi:cytochrome P450
VTDPYWDPYDFDIDEDPYPILKRLRDERPLYYNEKYDFFAVSRFADVKAASVDYRSFSSSQGTVVEIIRSPQPTPPGLFISEDPPLHTLHRNVLSRAVTPRRVAALEPRIRKLCAEYLDPHVGGDGFDVVREFAANIPMRVIGELLGVPEEDQLMLRDKADETARLDKGEPDEPDLEDFGREYAPYLAWRRQHPSDDFMTVLLQATFTDENGVERHLTEREILSYVGMLYFAGNETTARLIGWTAKVLAEHPDQRKELRTDPALIPGAIEELLRYEAPSPVQARLVVRDSEFYGETVPEGAVLVLLTGSANRDERKYPDPDHFDIHRNIDHHITFGYGIHYCFGAALARIEGRIALEELLARFPTWEVDIEGAEMIHTSTVRGYHRLPIRV